MEQYEITFLLDERFPSNYGEVTTLGIQITQDKQDMKKSWATVRVESDSHRSESGKTWLC